jgi:protease IV
MAKFLIGLLTGIVVVVLGIFLLFFALLRFREKPPSIADNSVLVLHLEGAIPEKPPLDLSTLIGNTSPLTMTSVWLNLRKAAADPHIKALVLEPEGLTAGWGKLEELRSDVEQFRKSNKPVYAYLRTPSAREYYVSLGANRILIGDSDSLFLKGLRAEVMYFKKTLDKLGVSVEVEHAGKYKDFGDMFTRSDMSPETREQVGAVVDGIYGGIVARIAEARKKSPDEVRAIIDSGPFTSTQALKAGLVDELRFEDQVFGELKDQLHSGDPARVSIDRYSKVPPESANLAGKSRIAIVAAQGDIVRGSADDDGANESSLTSYGFNKLLRQVGSDSNIKGVIVRIDSPGGEVGASDEMWREMNLLGKKKPVVISMSDVAASGGYYMAMTGAPIVAYPQTETGSIGVVFGKPNLHGLYDKLGVNKDAVQQGKHADIDSDYTPLTDDERNLLRKGIDESYRDFVSKVAAARHHTYQEIDAVAQGRVWLGSAARDHGLVDELGGIDTAIALLKKRANIPAGENVNVDLYPAQRGLLDLLMKRSQSDMLEARLRQVFGRVPFHAWMRGGYLRMMPYWLEVR